MRRPHVTTCNRPTLVSMRRGAWRSLVSAPVWGTGGPEFESRRPDLQKAPLVRGFRVQRGSVERFGWCLISAQTSRRSARGRTRSILHAGTAASDAVPRELWSHRDRNRKPGRPDSPAGSVIYRGGDEPNLLVVDRLAGDDPEVFDMLVVEPV